MSQTNLFDLTDHITLVTEVTFDTITSELRERKKLKNIVLPSNYKHIIYYKSSMLKQ